MTRFNFLLATIIVCLLAFSCKKDNDIDPQSEAKNLLFQSYQILELAKAQMIKIGDSLDITPPEALYYTEQFLQNVPEVLEVYRLDTTHLTIVTTGGYSSSIVIDIKGSDNLSKYRGGAGSTAFSKLTSSSTGSCSNEIKNKKVLLYAASFSDFYLSSEFQRVVDAIEGGNVDVDVTTFKDGQCSIDLIYTFDQYGFVILDTHGEISGILTGVNFNLHKKEIPNSMGDFIKMIATNIGAEHVPLLLDKKLSIDLFFEYNDSTMLIQETWDKYKDLLAILMG